MRYLVILGVLLVLPVSAGAQSNSCTLIREDVTASGRVCIYDCMGERRQSTIERHQRCPKRVEIPSASDQNERSDREGGGRGSDGLRQDKELPPSGRLN